MKRKRMPVEEYLKIAIDPAWKVEYIGGEAIWEPRHALVPVKAPIIFKEYSPPCEIRQLRENDTDRLIFGFLTAFADTIDFCDCNPAHVQQIAARCVRKAFEAEVRIRICITRRRGRWGSRIVGAALFLKGEDAPHLDTLFVVPEWQRRGVATAMFSPR